MVQRDFAPRGYVRQLLKDLEMVSAWAGKLQSRTPVLESALAGVPRAEEAGTQRTRHLGGGEAISEGVTLLPAFGVPPAGARQPALVGQLDRRPGAARRLRPAHAQFLALGDRHAGARAVRAARAARPGRAAAAARRHPVHPFAHRHRRVPEPGLPRPAQHHGGQRGPDQLLDTGVLPAVLLADRPRARVVAADRRHARLPRRHPDHPVARPSGCAARARAACR